MPLISGYEINLFGDNKFNLAQQLQDKSHNWEDLQTLILNTIAQGLCGYAFTCPDLIRGR
jgi:hypothetical protein